MYYSLAVGVGVTMASAVIPSWRAANIAPMAAIRSAAVEETDGIRRRLAIGLVGAVIGVSALMWGLFGSPSNRALLIGIAAGLIFLSVAALGPFHPGAARGGEDARQRASAARRAHAITITMMATPVVLTEPQARADDSLGHPAPSDFLVRCKQVRFRQTRAAARDYCC